MPARFENFTQCHNRGSNEAVCDIIVLYVQMEFLQVFGPLMMAIILQLPLCLHKLKRSVICVDDYLLPQNIMITFSACLHNRVHILIIGGVHTNSIKECIIVIGHRVTSLSDDSTNSIIWGICFNLKWLFRSSKVRTSVEKRWCFSSTNALCCALDQKNFPFAPPLVTLLKDKLILENPKMNFP